MSSVYLAEGFPLFRTGLAQTLPLHPEITTVHSIPTAEQLKLRLLKSPPDLLILDTDFLAERTPTWLRGLVEAYPHLPVLLFSTDDRPATVRRFMQAGSRAYLLKNASEEELFAAISTLLSDEPKAIYLQPALQQRISYQSLGIRKRGRDCCAITKREREVLHLIIEEFTTKEIAAKLFISDCTVESHRTNLTQKLGVKNMAGLVRVALESGLYRLSF